MVVTLLGFIVGGHLFAVPTAPTVVAGLDMPVNLTDRNTVRATVNVTQAAAGAQGVVQCSPDGTTWSTLTTVSFATIGVAATSLRAGGLLDFQSIPVTCRRDVRIRSILQNGAGAQVRVTYLALEFN